MKYGVSSRAGFLKRSGNPRPEYQVLYLNFAEPVGSGTFYWYTILNRTPDRASAKKKLMPGKLIGITKTVKYIGSLQTRKQESN